jgi:hypothetical protein
MRPALPLMLAALAMLASPAAARERCDLPDGPGLHVKFSISYGKRDRQMQEMIDMIELRKRGIEARTVTRTADGCLEVWAPDGQGGWATDYYDADTFELKLD